MTDLLETLRRTILRDGAGHGDDQLLSSFVERHDEAALAALVRRHGPMVWGVCRRLLAHHDAEDAFQATFLVLVRKAASVAPRAMVGNWLYGVAHQTALHARRTASRRRTREVQVKLMPDTEAVPEDQWADVRPVLDEELSRLPDIYRAVLVLCDLEGRTRKAVARELGVPDGTVGGRLVRARVLLAKRLAQRGVVLSGGALAGVLSAGSATASAAPSLVASTIKVASLLAAGRAAGGVSVKVAALTEGVVKAMFVTKIKGVLAAVLAAVLVGGGVAISLGQPPGSPLPKKADPEAKPVKAKEDAADKKLEAGWAVVSVEDSDKNTLDSDPIFSHAAGTQAPVRNARLTLRAGKFTLKTGLVSLEGTYTLDPSVTPKGITLGVAPEPGSLLSIQGVYSLDGDNLTLTFDKLPASQLAGLAGKDTGVRYTLKREALPVKDADNPKKR